MFAEFKPIVSRPKLKLAVAALCVLPFASTANALTATSNFNAQITVTSACVVNSTTTMDFGSQGVLTANVDMTSTLAVQCTNTTPYNIGLDKGLGNGATLAVRKMSNGSNTINYSLYSDMGRTTGWGDVVNSNTVAGTGNGASQNYTVYGRVPAQTTPTAAAYTDTITVTVTY